MKITSRSNLSTWAYVRWLLLTACAAMLLGLAACRPGVSTAGIPIRIGMESTAVNSLIYLAESRGYFDDNGLNATLHEYASGLTAVEGMLKGEVDIATAAEFVVVGKAFEAQPILTLGSVDKFMHNYLIGRKDGGIQTVADLAGKRIGLPLKTAAEFYLGRFLDLHGMSIDQVILIQVNPPQLVEILENGEVDAVIAWQPNAMALEERLGNGIVKWPVQNEQVTYCNLISNQAWVEANSLQVRQFLKSLAQAEAYLIRHPDDTRAQIQEWLRYEDAYMAVIWEEHEFQLSLDQSLILAMEDEARWMFQNNLADQKQMPNFLNYIGETGLAEVKPEAVNIIR